MVSHGFAESGRFEHVLQKMFRYSEVLNDIDEWLEGHPPKDLTIARAEPIRGLSFDTLDAVIRREQRH